MKHITHSDSNVTLPNGIYRGQLSGYQVTVTIKASVVDPQLSLVPSHKVESSFSVVDGIRGVVECTVNVSNNTAVVEW